MDSNNLKTLYRPTLSSWLVVGLFSLLLMVMIVVIYEKCFKVMEKGLLTSDSMGCGLLILIIGASVIFVLKELFKNSLSQLSFNSSVFYMKSFLGEKIIVWREIENISFKKYKGANTILIMNLSNGGKLKLNAVFGPIGGLVYKKLKEYRSDLIKSSKESDEIFGWSPENKT